MKLSPTIKHCERLHRVLHSHYKSLAEAGSSKELLDDYLRLLRVLRANGTEYIDMAAKRLDDNRSNSDAPSMDIAYLLTVPLNTLERVVQDSDTPRRLLEGVAVQRFSVPKGSLRQYSSKQLLAEKLKSMIDNERTHNTIGEIARSHES